MISWEHLKTEHFVAGPAVIGVSLLELKVTYDAVKLIHRRSSSSL
jgi:hypothetical protein